MFGFELDSAKSAENLVKHGIDFASAQAIWRDTRRLEVPARTTNESRWMVIGQGPAGQCWSAVVTYRDDHVRITSVCRSREGEVAIYEG